MKVLVVDDEPVARAILLRIVATLGHVPLEASNGLDAIRVFDVERPEVVVSDWRMPGCDGMELCRRVRQHPGAQYTYVVIVTGNAGQRQYVDALDAGADDYLVKPVTLQVLQTTLSGADRVLTVRRMLEEQRSGMEKLRERGSKKP